MAGVAGTQEPLVDDGAAAATGGGGSGGKPKAKTEYVILASVDGGTTWTVEGESEATNKANAASHFYEDRDLPEAPELNVHPSEYVLVQAVPKSSWKALKPRPPQPRYPFSEAD